MCYLRLIPGSHFDLVFTPINAVCRLKYASLRVSGRAASLELTAHPFAMSAGCPFAAS